MIDTAERRDWAWLTPGRFAVGLAALVALTHPELVLGWRTLVARDFGVFSYPLAVYQRESLWQGEWPLWNPYSNCGVPFLAQWNTVACSPLSLLYLLLPLPWSLNLFVLFFQFWAGLGMYLLAYRWTQHRLAAGVAGVGFAFSGFITGCFMWSNLSPICWMPWMIWLVEEAWQKGGRRWLLAAVAGALQMLGGAPDATFLTWVVLTLLFLVELAGEQDQRVLRVARFGGLILVIAGLSAMQLLPFFELLRHSERSATYGTGDWSIPAWGWANLLVPLFRVVRGSSGVAYQPGQYFISSYYPGAGILALGLFALWRVRSRRVWLLGVILGFSLLYALGDQGGLYAVLRRAVPAIGAMRYPSRLILLAVLVLPLLAALAIKEWTQVRPEQRPRWERGLMVFGAVLLLAMGALVFCAGWRPLHELDFSQTVVSAGSRAMFLVFALTLGGLFVRIARAKVQWAAGGLLVLVWLDGATHSPGQNPTTDPAILMGKGPALERMDPVPALGQSRALLSFNLLQSLNSKSVADPMQDYLIRRLALVDSCNLLDRVPKVDGFFSVHLATERDVHFRLFGPDGAPRPRLADFLGVTQALLSERNLDWEPRATALPLVTAGQRPVFLDTGNTLDWLMSETFMPKEMVCLPREIRSQVTATNTTSARVLDLHFTPHRITFTVEAAAPSLVVIAQCHYPCWNARVDDTPVPLWRANHAFQALEVPPGRHQVSLAYVDRAFQTGLVLSALTALGCVAVGAIRSRRSARLATTVGSRPGSV